jgi:hypothetical protein
MAQCPNCRFENLPQYKTCVRCGSILSGNSDNAPMKIEPPRAGRLEKILRLSSVFRLLNRLSVNCVTIGRRGVLQLQTRSADMRVAPMFLTGMIPGLPQWYWGRKPHEKIFFFGWLLFLLLAFLTFGRPVSFILFGLAIAMHLSSIVDIAVSCCQYRSDRLFLFSIMMIGAVTFFYVPTSSVCWRYFGAQGVTANFGSLRNGDMLLYTMSWTTVKPKTGDFVLYIAPDVNYPSPGPGHVVNRLSGNMFDRVLALEGQTVSWLGGKLTIDGEPLQYQPFVPFPTPPDTTFVVPEGQCYIIPTVAFSRLRMPTEASHWQKVGLVPYESIYGVVWGVRRSLFRFVDIRETNQPEIENENENSPPTSPDSLINL